MDTLRKVLLTFILLGPGAVYAYDCDQYHKAIMDCSAKDGCDTTIDAFASCLVEQHGITDKADDGVDEIKELVACFHTEYHCEDPKR
jgi:hypothetical protein